MYNLAGVTGQSPGLLNEVIGWFGIDPIDFLRDADIVPWNNFFIMVIMIWIQTGFAMVVLSAAIKAVPSELHRGGQGRRRQRHAGVLADHASRRSRRRSSSS